MLKDTETVLDQISSGETTQFFFEHFEEAKSYVKKSTIEDYTPTTELEINCQRYDSILNKFNIIRESVGEILNAPYLSIMRRLEQDIMLKASIWKAKDAINLDKQDCIN